MSAQEWLPWVVPSATPVLISTFVLFMYRGRVVSKTEVDRIERIYRETIVVYKDAAAEDKDTIGKLSASIEKMSEAQRTTNSLIQGLHAVVDARNKSTTQGSP